MTSKLLPVDDIILNITAVGYTVSCLTCGYAVVNRHGNILCKVRKGGTQQEIFNRLYEKFRSMDKSHN